jgi:hypothetical protein
VPRQNYQGFSPSLPRRLASVLPPSVCCLIHAMYELGIDPKLAEVGAVPTILKFVSTP